MCDKIQQSEMKQLDMHVRRRLRLLLITERNAALQSCRKVVFCRGCSHVLQDNTEVVLSHMCQRSNWTFEHRQQQNCAFVVSGVTTSEAPWGKHFRRPPLPQGMSKFTLSVPPGNPSHRADWSQRKRILSRSLFLSRWQWDNMITLKSVDVPWCYF